MKKLYWIVLAVSAAVVCLVWPMKLLLEPMGTTPGFQGESPFGHSYCLEDGASQIRLSMYNQLEWLRDGAWTESGKFEFKEASEDGTGLWVLDDGSYRLTAKDDGAPILSYWEDGQMRWESALARVDTLYCAITDRTGISYPTIGWFPEGAFDGDLSRVNACPVKGEGTLTMGFRLDGGQTLTVMEERHVNGMVETVTHLLDPDGKQEYTLEISGENRTPGDYILYRIRFASGEYIIGITF